MILFVFLLEGGEVEVWGVKRDAMVFQREGVDGDGDGDGD